MIHIMSGLPASGKSTYCEKMGQANNDVVIHRDVVRAQLRAQLGSTEVFPCSAEEEYEYFTQYLSRVINSTERDVWIDQTTLNTGAALKLLFALDKLIDWSNLSICFEVMHTPIEVCIERDSHRTGYEHVTEEIIRNMNKGFNISLANVARKAPDRMTHHMMMKHHDYKEDNNE